MARILITGSVEGLGLLAGRRLAAGGHKVTLHARNEKRAADARRALPQLERVVVGDLSTLAGMRQTATDANDGPAYDAVIHNAAIGDRERARIETEDGLERVFATNALAPYVLTAIITPPRRLAYLTSGLHRGGSPDLGDAQWTRRRYSGSQAYADSKLFNVILAFAIARLWPAVFSNSVEPGWVPTRMGGAGAPDDLELGALTQAWLAVSDDPGARVSGRNFYHQKPREAHAAAGDPRAQDAFIAYCAKLSGVELPA
jgi:NAD(P)-dependent dehydrogenase (short-subunit alcohol dehydrogenase family)